MNNRVLYGRLGGQARLNAYIRSLGPAAWFRMDQGVTVTGAGISQVDDLSGNARHLLDPGTTRPIYLPYSGTRYLYLPGVAGNFADSPDSAAVPTGDIDILVRALASDWTPSSLFYLAGKYNSSAGEHSFAFRVETTGLLRFIHSQDGTVDISAVSTSGPSLSDGVAYWLRVTRASASGDVIFYKAADSQGVPTSWTKVGNTVSTTAGAIRDSGADITIGAIENAGTGGPMMGNIYRAIIKDGIDGTTVVDFNPADASDGATSFASSATGETWTINRSGSLPAYIVGMAGAMGNGSSHYLRASFTSDQPITDYWVGRPLSWTAGDQLIGGVSANAGAIEQSGSTPAIVLYDGSAVASNTNLALNARAVVCAVHNGANGVLRVNNTTETTGNSGSGNPGGITLFANNTPSGFANAIAYELVRFHAAHDLATRARIVAGLMARHGVA